MRKQNVKVIGAFLEHKKATSGTRLIEDRCYHLSKGASISTDGQKLYSYWTIIAEWDGDKVLVNNKKYSNTTTLQQHDLALMLSNAGIASEEMGAE